MSPNVYLLIASIGLSIFCLGAYFYISQISTQSSRKSTHGDQLNKLIESFIALSKSINLLRDASSEYFITLNENGFSELCNIESALQSAIETCETLQKERNHDRLEQTIKYLYIQRGRGSAPQFLWNIIGEQTTHLENWGERAKDLILRITEGVNESSNNLKEIGGNTRRKRKNTIMMLNEARLALDALS